MEFSYPRIIDDGEDELRYLALHRLVCAAAGAIGLARCFRVHTDNGRGIVINRRVVGSNVCWFGKLRAIAHCVRCHQPNEADEVVCAPCFVVRYLEEEQCQDLPD